MEKKLNFAEFLGQNCGKIGRFCRNFAGIFGANLAGKQSIKKRWILWLFSGQISPEINWICTDQTSVFNVFLTEVVICSFNNNTLQKWTNGKAFKSWLVPSFSQHNLRLVVLFAHFSVRNIRSPHEWDISTIHTIIFRLFYRSLHPMGCMPWIILCLWGFLCIRDAGCRGNKITDTVWKNNSIARHSACSKVSPQSIG